MPKNIVPTSDTCTIGTSLKRWLKGFFINGITDGTNTIKPTGTDADSFYISSINSNIRYNEQSEKLEFTNDGTNYYQFIKSNTEAEIVCNSSTIEIDWDICNQMYIVLDRDVTFTFDNMVAGNLYRLRIEQDEVGSRLATFPGIIWRNGTEPTLTTDSECSDWLTILYSGGQIYADLAKNFS